MISTGDTDCKECGGKLFAQVRRYIFGKLFRWRCVYCGNHRKQL